MPGYSHIMVAVDFSRGSASVVEKALQLRQAFGARISLIHVVEFVQMDISNDLIIPAEVELEGQLVEIAERRLKQLARDNSIDETACHVSQGSTRNEILRVTEEKNVDLIVIGSHGRHGIQLLLGSTANSVLHGAPCDVLAVRIKE